MMMLVENKVKLVVKIEWTLKKIKKIALLVKRKVTFLVRIKLRMMKDSDLETLAAHIEITVVAATLVALGKWL